MPGRRMLACGHSTGRYVRGCLTCRSYQSTRVRANRAARKVTLAHRPHGVLATRDAGCTCTPCRDVKNAGQHRRLKTETAPCPVCTRMVGFTRLGLVVRHRCATGWCPGAGRYPDDVERRAA